MLFAKQQRFATFSQTSNTAMECVHIQPDMSEPELEGESDIEEERGA